MRLSVVALAAGVITAGIVWFDPEEKLAKFSRKPINSVQLEGSFRYLDKEASSNMVAGLLQGSFLDLDIEALKLKLEENPWIDSVSISRSWPDKLIVRIKEQQPIAQWGNKAFLNMRGDIIEVANSAKIRTLPQLIGRDDHAKEIMQQYLSMSRILTSHDMGLTSVTLDDTLAWTISLREDIQVKLGRKRVLQKLQNLVVAKNKILRDGFFQAKAIDMRYPSGFAVAWKDEKKYVAADFVNDVVQN